jgi:hypothetical protein
VISVVTVRVTVRRLRAKEGVVTREALLMLAKLWSATLPSVDTEVRESVCESAGVEPAEAVVTIVIAVGTPEALLAELSLTELPPVEAEALEPIVLPLKSESQFALYRQGATINYNKAYHSIAA